MSDIFNPPKLPNDSCVECPECGRPKGENCGAPENNWNHDSRIWAARSIFAIEELKMPEPKPGSVIPTEYEAGWNDAIDAIIERLKK